MHAVRIWDLPTRVFHWALTVCVVGLLITGTVGGGWLEWHLRFGYSVMTLLLFRLAWGFVGGHWSRFGNFVYGPASLRNYLGGRAQVEHMAGHNPLGALAVFALLLALLAQVGSGLISDDEIATFGPLVRFVSGDTVSAATAYHKNVGKLLILSLVGIHLMAIAVYTFVKRQALTRAMVTGDKMLAAPVTPVRDTVSTRILALGILLACALLVRWVVGLGQVVF